MTKQQMLNISDFHKFFLGLDLHPDFFSNSPMTGYPRYNVVRVGNSGHRVEVAVPGWDKEDIEITFHKNELRIEGTAKQVAEENEDYLYKGLSGKTFSRVFKVGNNIELETAYMKNGLLCVELTEHVPEEDKPKRIEIIDAA
jgi:molecular chaperone IbpA|tara:strand:+ start:662 stop:1087 length:426 start_codon:yes stop_codon:yes gene_type:complete